MIGYGLVEGNKMDIEQTRYAFRLGLISYEEGLEQIDNPYDPKLEEELDLYLSWLDGWIIAKHDCLQVA